MFVIESDFDYKDYRCVTIFGDMGWRCGYVGVPEGNSLYGKEYTDYVDIAMDELNDEPIGKRGIVPVFLSAWDDSDNVRMDLYFNVHGGLTFSGDEHPIECGLWWLGFDCGHYGDGKDLDKVEELWGDNERIKVRLEIERRYPSDEPVRSLEYVQEECRNLVDQIIAYEGGIDNE